MIVGDLTIQFNPGDSYTFGEAQPEAPEPEKERSRGEARAEAIAQFRAAAQRATMPNIHQCTQQLLALLIQFKALGGSMTDSPIPNQLREAADFMEDL
jgi:hypothetical protein